MSDPVNKDLCMAYQSRLETRLDGMDYALTNAKVELERRLHDLNELRSTFEHRLTVIETRALTWTTVIGLGFIVLQIVLHFVK